MSELAEAVGIRLLYCDGSSQEVFVCPTDYEQSPTPYTAICRLLHPLACISDGQGFQQWLATLDDLELLDE